MKMPSFRLIGSLALATILASCATDPWGAGDPAKAPPAAGSPGSGNSALNGDWTPDALGTAWPLKAATPIDPASYAIQAVGNMTVFAFCDAAPGEDYAPIYDIRPDLSTRSTLKYGNRGVRKEAYDFGIVAKYHARGIAYMGGVSTTAISRDEFSDARTFEDFAMRDSNGVIVDWSEFLGPDMYRGNIANPKYRDYIIGLAKMQIDGGADGIHFDEVDGGYLGGPARAWTQDSGFDDYNLADFNRYLLAKYPSFAFAEWKQRFGMDERNYPRADVPADDLARNFNYRRYLKDRGWNHPSFSDGPMSAANPLAREWGTQRAGRMYRDESFIGTYVPRYWKAIVDAVREYAKSKYGKDILITNNGVAPYVDFVNMGLWDENQDGPDWSKVDWVPTAGGQLNGSKSLRDAFLYVRQKGIETAGNAPVILFIDYPTPMLERWFKFPLSQRKDYWRIYGAEAYACGLYWAFPLKEQMPGYLDAATLGVAGFFRDYGNFFRENADLYHDNALDPQEAKVDAAHVSAVLQNQSAGNRSVLHLVNHNYDRGLKAVGPFTASISGARAPRSVEMVSPDRAGRQPIEWSAGDGRLTVTVPLLEAYDAIVIQY